MSLPEMFWFDRNLKQIKMFAYGNAEQSRFPGTLRARAGAKLGGRIKNSPKPRFTPFHRLFPLQNAPVPMIALSLLPASTTLARLNIDDRGVLSQLRARIGRVVSGRWQLGVFRLIPQYKTNLFSRCPHCFRLMNAGRH